MKKRLAMFLGLTLILSPCGTFAIEDTSSSFEEIDDLREGTSAETVSTPDDFPSEYHFGSGRIQDFSRANMLCRLPEPKGNATVLNTAADPDHIQALYLWEEDNVPARTRFTRDMTGYFDPWDFRFPCAQAFRRRARWC